MKELHLVIVSPERTVFDGTISSIQLPGEAGRFQVLHNHAPLISTLVEGDVKYTTTDGEQTLHIASGFADVNNNEISVCVEL